MAKSISIRVRVSKNQFDLIKNKADVLGFKTISAFIRDAALKDLYYVNMLKDIYQEVCKKKII